jgi:hypothetical protein
MNFVEDDESWYLQGYSGQVSIQSLISLWIWFYIDQVT